MTRQSSAFVRLVTVCARAAVKILLLTHPVEFRRRFREEVLRDVTADIRDAGAAGSFACVVAGVKAVADGALALRTARHTEPQAPRQRQSWLRDALSDARLAIRGFRREPTFSLAVAGTLALGIGLNSAMFGVVDRLLLRGPEHVRDAGHVYRLQKTTESPSRGALRTGWFGYVAYDALRKRGQFFEGIAAYSVAEDAGVLGRGIDARRINKGEATANLFPLLGVTPALGRFYTEAEDDVATPQPVVVIGYGVWQRDFGGRDDVIGKTVVIDNALHTIVGVAPRGFTGPDLVRVDVWVPESLVGRRVVISREGWTQSWNANWLSIVVRLKPGVSADRADAETTAILRAAYTGPSKDQANATFAIRPLLFARDGTQTLESRVSSWLMAVAGVVLAIACANVINLVLARGIRRRREMAVRLALGAGRARLVRLLVVEGVTLATIGGAIGVAIAYVVGLLMRATLRGIEWPGSPVNMRVLIVSAVVALAAGVIVGLLPAVAASKPVVSAALKTGARDGGGQRGHLRPALTIVQAALSALLLIGSGLFVLSLDHVRSLDLGLQPDRVLTFAVQRSGLNTITDEAERKREQARRADFYPMVIERLRQRSDVEAASLAIGLPFQGSFGFDIRVAGRDSIPQLKGGGPYISAVTPDYFKTVGTRVLRGRGFSAEDRAGSQPVVIVNETMAATLWPSDEAIGKCFYVGDWPACVEVVGIAANTRQSRLREDEAMAFYVPFGQEQGIGGTRLLVRPRGDSQQVMSAVRQELIALDSTISFVNAGLLQDRLDPQVRPWLLGATMFSLMGVLALLVAAVGIYSVMAYLVTQRTHEIGVRMALGARPADVANLVLRGGLGLAAVGVLAGLTLAFLASKYVEPLLFDTSARTPVVYASVAIILLVVASLAGLIPAARARRVNPVEAMRTE